MNDIYIRLIKLPSSVRGFTAPDADGNYNVYINEGLTPEQARKTYRHELKHIRQGDIESPEESGNIELEGHK